jgi:hypothetical protein
VLAHGVTAGDTLVHALSLGLSTFGIVEPSRQCVLQFKAEFVSNISALWIGHDQPQLLQMIHLETKTGGRGILSRLLYNCFTLIALFGQ